jgi:hypothetical protein
MACSESSLFLASESRPDSDSPDSRVSEPAGCSWGPVWPDGKSWRDSEPGAYRPVAPSPDACESASCVAKGCLTRARQPRVATTRQPEGSRSPGSCV